MRDITLTTPTPEILLLQETELIYEDILFEKRGGIATISINRPDVLNAFRGQTVEELIRAFDDAGWDSDIGVIVLTFGR